MQKDILIKARFAGLKQVNKLWVYKENIIIVIE
jgi:hypothetical protein